MSMKNGFDHEGSELPKLVLADISDPKDIITIDAFVKALIESDESPAPTTGMD